MKLRALHMADAIQYLSDGEPHTLMLWKLSTGAILLYKDVVLCGSWKRGGMQRVRFPNGQIRAFRDVSLIAIDGLSVYL